jgi:hypothetical protein
MDGMICRVEADLADLEAHFYDCEARKRAHLTVEQVLQARTLGMADAYKRAAALADEAADTAQGTNGMPLRVLARSLRALALALDEPADGPAAGQR